MCYTSRPIFEQFVFDGNSRGDSIHTTDPRVAQRNGMKQTQRRVVYMQTVSVYVVKRRH